MENTTEKPKEQEWHHVVTINDEGDLKKHIHIVYDSIGVQMAFDKATEYVGKNVQIKGFRKGKAPAQLVKNYCKKEIESSASSMLSNEGYLHACYENKLRAMGEPDVKNAEFDLDGTFSCDIHVEVSPTVNPTGYLGLQLVKPVVDREAVERQVFDSVKNSHIVEKDIDEVSNGSVLVMDYTITNGEEEPVEQKDFKFVVSETQEAPFGKNLIGKKAGDELLETTALPEEHGADAGKEVIVNIKIKEVKERVELEGDELAEAAGFSDEEGLRIHLSEKVAEDVKAKEMQGLQEAAVDKLIELHDFEVPEKWVKQEAEYMARQIGLQNQDGDKNALSFLLTMAERNVRRAFILEAIYEEEPQAKITENEFQSVLEQQAKAFNVSSLKLKKDLEKNGMMQEFLSSIRHGKVMNLIVSQVQLVDPPQEQEEANVDGEMPENPLG